MSAFSTGTKIQSTESDDRIERLYQSGLLRYSRASIQHFQVTKQNEKGTGIHEKQNRSVGGALFGA